MPIAFSSSLPLCQQHLIIDFSKWTVSLLVSFLELICIFMASQMASAASYSLSCIYDWCIYGFTAATVVQSVNTQTKHSRSEQKQIYYVYCVSDEVCISDNFNFNVNTQWPRFAMEIRQADKQTVTLDSNPVRNFISIDFLVTPSLSPSAAERIICKHKLFSNNGHP